MEFREHLPPFPYTDVYDFLRQHIRWTAEQRCGTKVGGNSSPILLSGFERMLAPPEPLDASVANLQPGDLVEAAIFSFDDDSFTPQFPLDYESTSKRCHTIEPGSEWWPVICRMVPACLLYTSPSPRDGLLSRMPSSA